MGGRRLGRSEPAFRVPAPPYSLHQPAMHDRRPANFICGRCFAARPANCWLFVLRPVPGGESAGCVACSGLVQQAVLAFHLCHFMPTALIVCPVLFNFALPPVHYHVRQDRRRKLYGLSCWQLQHGPAVAARAPVHVLTLVLFPAESIDPEPWLV